MARKPKILPRKKPEADKAAKPAVAPKPKISPSKKSEAVEAPEVTEKKAVSEETGPAPAGNARDREAAQVFAYATNLHRQGHNEKAVQAYSRVLNLAPGNPDIYSNMGICLRAQGKLVAAATCYRRALVLRPDDSRILSNLGNVLRDMSEFNTAISCLSKALAIHPDQPQELYNMGLALRDVGEVDKAIRCFEKAISINENYIICHVELGYTLLMKGEYERGFAELVWRMGLQSIQDQMPQGDLWEGQALGGKSILIYQDSGLGDVIQFSRYLRAVKDSGANVIVECHAKSAPLVAMIDGVDKVCISGNQRPDCDVHTPFMNLPFLLSVDRQALKDQTPYINVPDTQSVTLPPAGGLQIRTGFCWSPDVMRKGAADRSCQLDKLLKLLVIPGITAFSLQGGERAQDVQEFSCPALITDLASQIKDLADLASAISQLDLVICVDSVTAHVAGAMGKPVWVLLPYVSDWRWHPSGDLSVWYSQMRIFRQTRPDDWENVLNEVQEALHKHATRRMNA
ncbi:MAG: tetratricopeptide repeat protein [Rhodospirillales bacterium]|nr:tetratricopeptide repeat protein [Rhodospirillales bacterium]